MNEVNRLRARLDLLTRVVIAQTIVVAAILIIAAKKTDPMFDTIRARHVVVVDEKGVQRVHIGAPVPDPIVQGRTLKRDDVAAGVMIYDAKGNERGGYVTSGGNALLTLDNEVDQAVTLVAYPQSGSEAGLKHGKVTTERVDIREPDGTLRMVISNHAKLPGVIVRGKETKLDRPQAGMIFYNDEGSENGGLIFGGRRNANGEVVDSGGSLSFDKYDANQIVQLIGVDDKEDRFAGLVVTDSPTGTEVHRRVWVGRDDSGTASLALMDARGRKRIMMTVATDGTPSIAFLDSEGKIVKQIAP